MRLPRRKFLALAPLALGLGPHAISAAPAPASSAPTLNKLRMLIPANPGGGWDQTGHALGDALLAAAQVGSIEYENKGGKGGILGLAHFVERYPDDASTLMVGGFVMVGSIALNRPKVNLSEVRPIARLTTELLVLVVPAASKLRTLQDFESQLKADPAAMAVAGGGAGGVDHMCTAMLARAAGADLSKLTYVPFSSGTEVLAALTSGKVAAGVSGYGELKEGIASGKLRALGLSSRRSTFGIPTFREQGSEVVVGNWRGVFAAKSLSDAQAETLRSAVQKATAQPTWKEALTRNNWTSDWQSGADFRQALDIDQSMASALVHMLKLKAA